MFTSIKLQNFKIFKEVTVPLSNLNLLTGTNGSGKSTLLQSILMMRQSIDHNPNTNQIILNGSAVNLGVFTDVKNIAARSEIPVKVEYQFRYKHFFRADTLLHGNIKYEFISDENNDRVLDMNQLEIEADDFELYSYRAFKEDERENPGEFYKKVTLAKPAAGNAYHIMLDDKQLTELTSFNNLIPTGTFFGLGFRKQKGVNTSPLDNWFTFFRNIHYVGADRLGPQPFYPKENIGGFLNVGKKGEFTINILSRLKDFNVNESLYLGNNTITLLDQTSEWLSKILDTPNLSIEIDDNSNDHIITLGFKMGNATVPFKPSNVGFGYTYILPIIVSGLIAKPGETLIIENPEAHLHPKAQSELIKFLAKVADCGVQVFVETHSEHILNGLRVVVVDQEEHKDFGSKNASVLYFQKNEEQPFVQIPIEENGKIKKWPEGFFDQMDKDLDRLLEG